MPTSTIAIFIILFVVVFGVNAIPFFMPPTWLILTFCHVRFHSLFWPTIIIGALAAMLGRVMLAMFARTFGHLLPKKMLVNVRSLGDFAKKNTTFSIPALIVYAFLPIPSNQAFIAAGLTDINISWFAFSFFIGRILSYTFWVSAAHRIIGGLDNIFSQHLSRPSTFLFEFAGILFLILVAIIPWKKILPVPKMS